MIRKMLLPVILGLILVGSMGCRSGKPSQTQAAPTLTQASTHPTAGQAPAATSTGEAPEKANPAQALPNLSPTPAASPTLPIAAASPSPSPTSTQLSNETSPTATTTPAATEANLTATPALPPQANPTSTASPTPAPTSAPSPTPANPDTSTCTDKAAFFADVTVPDESMFRQGTQFVKTWRIRNEGSCSWGPNYHLVFIGGDVLNGAPSVIMPRANPGDIIDISVNLTAPADGGTYISYWEFQSPSGKLFGVNSGGVDTIWVKINVSYIVIGPTATPGANAAGCSVQASQDYVNQVLELVNKARTSQGLAPLNLQSQLNSAAQVHSQDMACHDFVDHVGSDGSNWFTRIKAQGYTYAYASENIYVGDPAFGGTAQGAFEWWMNSPIHRANILSSKITQIGIGYAYLAGSTYGGYYTMDFAKPTK
jgi:uncharacterized protein YkwD